MENKSGFVRSFLMLIKSLGGSVEIDCPALEEYTASAPSFEYKKNRHTNLVCGVSKGHGDSMEDAVISLAENMAGRLGHFESGQEYIVMPLIMRFRED
jgi:hypothetical protein